MLNFVSVLEHSIMETQQKRIVEFIVGRSFTVVPKPNPLSEKY